MKISPKQIQFNTSHRNLNENLIFSHYQLIEIVYRVMLTTYPAWYQYVLIQNRKIVKIRSLKKYILYIIVLTKILLIKYMQMLCRGILLYILYLQLPYYWFPRPVEWGGTGGVVSRPGRCTERVFPQGSPFHSNPDLPIPESSLRLSPQSPDKTHLCTSYPVIISSYQPVN